MAENKGKRRQENKLCSMACCECGTNVEELRPLPAGSSYWVRESPHSLFSARTSWASPIQAGCPRSLGGDPVDRLRSAGLDGAPLGVGIP